MSTLRETSLQNFDLELFIKFIGDRNSVMRLLPVMITQLSIKSESIKKCIDKNNLDEFKHLIEGIYETSLYGMKRLEVVSNKIYFKVKNSSNTINVDKNTLAELNLALDCAIKAIQVEIDQKFNTR